MIVLSGNRTRWNGNDRQVVVLVIFGVDVHRPHTLQRSTTDAATLYNIEYNILFGVDVHWPHAAQNA
jgi:hypothetical protein